MAKRLKKNKIALLSLKIIRFFSFLILFTPLIVSSKFFFPFVSPKSLYFMALAEIIFFAWLVLISIEPKYRPKFNLISLALIIYLFVFVLASIVGVNPSYSFWSKFERMTGILMHLHLFAFFLVLSSVFEKEDFQKLFAFSVFVAILASIVALIKLEDPTMRGGGTLGNESFLGTYLLFNCFFALYLIFHTRDFTRKLFIFSFLILTFSLLLIGVHLNKPSFSKNVWAIFLSEGARAAKISFYGGLVLLFFLWLMASRREILKIFGSLALSFSLIFISYALFSLITQPEGIVRKIVEREVGTFGGRFPVWQIAWKGFLEKPWLGWGPENFEYTFIKYFDPCLGTFRCGGEFWFDRAHNIVFDTLISTGILGFTSYLLIFLFSFFLLWKNFLKGKINFWPAGIFTALFVSYFVQNLTVFDMISSYLVFFLSLSFIASLEKTESFETTKNPNPIILISVLIFFLLSFYYFVFLPLRSAMIVISVIQAKPFSQERISLYKKAVSLSPLGQFQIWQFFAEDVIKNFFKKEGKNTKEELDFLVEKLKENIKKSPLDYRSYLRLGQILNLYSQLDPQKIFEAEEVLKKAREISPKNQQTFWALSQNMLLQGRLNEAISFAQEALNLEKNLETSWAIFLQVLKITGNLNLAKETLEEALKINPAWEKSLRSILENS